jgi:hypothetical protein
LSQSEPGQRARLRRAWRYVADRAPTNAQDNASQDNGLVFSWAWHSTPERQSQVTVALKPDEAGTLLTLHHERLFDEAARAGHERGWIAGLGKLDEFLATVSA